MSSNICHKKMLIESIETIPLSLELHVAWLVRRYRLTLLNLYNFQKSHFGHHSSPKQ